MDPIVNCHIHTFTSKNVPFWYPTFPLNILSRFGPTRWMFESLLRLSWPFSSKDVLNRLANFMAVSSYGSQRDLFENIRGRYPLSTKFVVLPMDMRGMKKGRISQDIEAQHEELHELFKVYPEQIIPFIHIDPRSGTKSFKGPKPIEMIERFHQMGFKGIKLYPPLGYDVEDVIMTPIYEYANLHSLPIMTHCSRGGVTGKGIKENMYDNMLAPHKYRSVLANYPNLRLCLAHFGGNDDWERFLTESWTDNNTPIEKMDWVSQIYTMIKSGEYPNLYTDISYTIFRFEQHVPVLKVFLTNENILKKTLFGSDYYMIELEKLRERELSMKLRGELGEEFFWRIAATNPKEYIGV